MQAKALVLLSKTTRTTGRSALSLYRVWAGGRRERERRRRRFPRIPREDCRRWRVGNRYRRVLRVSPVRPFPLPAFSSIES